MVSLKPTSIITAILINILIVLTFPDHAFSEETEVDKCIEYIYELYQTRDRKEIFKIGFLEFNEKVIEAINTNIVREKDDYEKSRLKKRNFYTFSYFLEVMRSVKVPNKINLPIPRQHCHSKYGGQNEALIQDAVQHIQHIPDQKLYEQMYNQIIYHITEKVEKCAALITLRFHLGSYETGAGVFNKFYEFWTKTGIEKASVYGRTHGFDYKFPEIFGALPSFYQIYEGSLDSAKYRTMTPQIEFCRRITGVSSSKIVEEPTYHETEEQEDETDEVESD